jgi:hypothetical protein
VTLSAEQSDEGTQGYSWIVAHSAEQSDEGTQGYSWIVAHSAEQSDEGTRARFSVTLRTYGLATLVRVACLLSLAERK